jgi:uncharacterized protein (TIGR01777 family)
MADLEVFTREVRIGRPAEVVFAWHEQPGAFARLTPPWERVEVLEHRGGIRDGARVRLRTRVGPVGFDWAIEHRDYVPGRHFRDVMHRGPFAHWDHSHGFESVDEQSCLLRDVVHYRLPGGVAGRLAKKWIRQKIEAIFAYRHAVTRADLETPSPPGADTLRRVLITGASGGVGSALVPRLTTAGCEVIRLVRRPARSDKEISWDPANGQLDLSRHPRCDAVVHLAGANIAEGWWTKRRRNLIQQSRSQGTATLAAALAALPPDRRPTVLASASAIGWYGDTGSASVTERSPTGDGFLAEVCREWEDALAPARAAGIRTVAVRTGVVLTPAGGALAKMLPVFKMGLAGRLGRGDQGMSWISAEDLTEVYWHALRDERVTGPVNAVAPAAVSNAEFTAVLGRVLARPTVIPVPAIVLRGLLGDLARETLLASSWVKPAALGQVGFVFRHPDLTTALRAMLGRGEEELG